MQADPAPIRSRLPVARIVAPESIAVVGASDDVGKFGGRVIHYLIRHGYGGRLLPINPNRHRIRDLPAFPRVSAAPGPIDVAVIAVPVGQLQAQVEDCIAAGVGAAVVITGKLADAGPEGAALQDRLVALARAGGMRLLGPNCLGIVNPVDRVALSSSLALEAPNLRAGGVAMVSQSGALMGSLIAASLPRGVGFSRCISVGNQADLELADFLEYLADDAATRAICLYVEGLKAPARFLAAARRARAAGKSVLAVKAGRSEAGAAGARSHTASLAGSWQAFRAAATAAGLAVLDDPFAMVLTADAIARLPPLAAAQAGVAVMASSGGSTAVLADQLATAGFRMADMAPATRAALGRWMPASHVHLPVDTGAFADSTSRQGLQEVLAALLANPGTGALAYPMTTQPAMAACAALVPRASRQAGKPVLFSVPAGVAGEATRQALRDLDFPYFDDGAQALAVLSGLREDATARGRAATPPAQRPPGAGGPLPDLPAGPLTESEAKALAASYGIEVAREAPAADAESAVAAAARIGYPAVVKGVSRATAHKTEAGLVRIALADVAAVRTAATSVLAALRRAPDGGQGLVVQEMLRGEAELILGARHDPQYGPLVLAGFGGIFAEVLKDVALEPAPVSRATAEAMLRRLAMAPVLQGARGRPMADIAAASDALVRLSWLAADLGPRLIEMDINPLIVRAAGQGAAAADARATLAHGGGQG